MADPHFPLPDLLEGVSAEAVEDQLRLAQQALGQLRESVVITDIELEAPGPRIVYANDAFTTMTGWRPEEVIGKSPRLLQGLKTTRQTATTALVRHILAFGRGLTGGSGAIDPRICWRKWRASRRRLSRSGSRSSLTPPPDSPSSRPTPPSFYQVLLNLCVNARYAIAGPGQITLAAQNLEKIDSLGTIRTVLEKPFTPR